MKTLIKVLATTTVIAFASGASAASKDVSFTFTVDSSKVTGGNKAILQVGFYAQHAGGTGASGIWDNIKLTGPTTMAGAAKPIPFSDDFNNRTLSDTTIGNNWTWYDHGFTSADCSTGKDEGYGPYSDGNGDDYTHANNNFTNVGGNGGGYFRAGLEDDGNGGAALNVYDSQYAKKACNEIKIFQEFSVDDKALLNGKYTFTATVKDNPNAATAEGNQVGVFFKVLDVDGGYAETQFTRETALPEQAGGGDGGGGDNGGGADTPAAPSVPVPVMPLGGLLGLIALVGWLGLRRRG